MKKITLLFLFVICAVQINAQCDDLFFSEYVEGYSSNKALEIYNPTDEAIRLSEYSIARASNGSTAPSSNQVQVLPDVMLEPNDVFVVVVDLRDTSLWDSQFDKPAWNGYNLIDTIFDIVTGLPVTDSLGNVITGPQYSESGSALFGDEYNEEYDLQCKADAFLCPDYDSNNTMYFNGNDAMILLKGNAISSNGDNILDVVGVIGEDPEDTLMEDAWVNEDGFWLTKNRTLVRKPEIEKGRNELDKVVFALGGTFRGEEWLSYPNNTFEYLGIHNSVCNNEAKPDRYSCSQGPLASLYHSVEVELNIFPNPVQGGMLNVESDRQIRDIEIYDLMGRKLFTQPIQDLNASFSVSQIQAPQGFVILKINYDEREFSLSRILIE